MEEAISLAKELNETNSLAVALHFAAFLARYQRNPTEVERLASDLIELATRQNFAYGRLAEPFPVVELAVSRVTQLKALRGWKAE